MLTNNLKEPLKKAQGLGEFLHKELGGKLLGDVIYAMEGCYSTEISDIPSDVSRNKVNKTIVRFYEKIGFTKDTESKLEDPIFYKGKINNKVRCIVLSDNREKNGSILVSVAPLYCTG